MTLRLATAALAASLTASTALAGGMAEPVMEMAPEIVVEEAAGGTSNAGLIIPLILIALIAAAASSGGESEPVQESDLRLKTDILPVGVTDSGLTLYQFRYIGQPEVWQGVMAQEVLAHTPEAVIPGLHGLMSVDYGVLGLEMTRVR